jgi:hypothetical protein
MSEVERLSKEIKTVFPINPEVGHWEDRLDELIAAVRAETIEECAKVCEAECDKIPHPKEFSSIARSQSLLCAQSIRNLGSTKEAGDA